MLAHALDEQVSQCVAQLNRFIQQAVEAGARDVHTARDVNGVRQLPDFLVRPWLEVEVPRLAHGPDDLVLLVTADGNPRVEHVGQPFEVPA